jgi:hypothetical protein
MRARSALKFVMPAPGPGAASVTEEMPPAHDSK